MPRFTDLRIGVIFPQMRYGVPSDALGITDSLLAEGAVNRDALVRGTYIPGQGILGHDTVGLRAGTSIYDLTNVYPGTDDRISITSGAPQNNMLYWGEISMKSSTTPTFTNCLFAGPDPRRFGTSDWTIGGPYTGNLSGVLKCYGAGYYHFNLTDCLIDPSVWMDPLLTRPESKAPTDLYTFRKHMAGSCALHGGRATFKRVEIKNVQDSVNWVQTRADTSDNEYTLFEDCWLHKNIYFWADEWTATNDGSHSDGFQTGPGRNLTLRGNYLGGVRDETGYNLYNGSNGPAYSYNTGDDAWNTEIMLQQVQSNTDELRKLMNITIEQNYFNGGTYCMNHSQSPVTWAADSIASTFIRDNFFVTRADNAYVIRNTAFSGCYSNNRKITINANGSYTIGAAINYTNG